MSLIEEYPQTPAEVVDLLHQKFGIGDFDRDAHANPPWWKERNTNIAKLKAMMRKRQVSERQLAVAAWYATHQGVPIVYYAQLFALIPEAMRSYRIAEQVEARKNARSEIDVAVSEAIEQGEQEWAERLLRADAGTAPRVLEEWRAR